ncbi:MAG: helix-turn-helix domain-containing protein [Acidimicrobiales bacterium]
MTDLAERLDATSVAADHAETKGERTRRRLLEIAVDRFGRRGFRATSVSEIAREAGLTQAAAYAYFDGKDALFAAAVDTDASDLLDQAGAQVEATPIDVLIPTIIVVLVVGLEDHPLTKRVLAGQEPEALPRLVDLPAVERFADRIGGRLTRGQATGEVRADIDIPVLQHGIESIVISLLMSSIQSGVALERHQLGVVAAFDAMLRPPT